jgi:uncharacterized protein (TIGR00255 family)
MTGYGRAERSINEKNFLIEIRSLNGKQFELLLKLPVQLKPFEFEIRSMLSEKLVRGSVECTVSIKQHGATKPSSINLDLAASYFKQLKSLADQLETDDSQLLASILRLPEVVANSTDVLGETEWLVFKEVLQEALVMINKHRMDEGAVLEKELLLRIANIEESQKKVIALDPSRKVKIRE